MSISEDKNKIRPGMKEFSLNIPEYDQSTYSGRFLSLMKTQNPLNTFVGPKVINASRKLIDEQMKIEEEALDKNKVVQLSIQRIKELRKAQYILASSVHPDTNEILHPWQRFCSYSIINIPILFGMILSRQTTTNIVIWQWVNQTYNAALNYSNRNASSNLDMKGLSISYFAAVTASISIGLGMRRLLSPYASKFNGPAQLFFNFLISVTAIGFAGVLNVLIMRSKEIQEGITLTDANGNEVGKSPKIGKEAVLKTAISRIILPIPPLLLPTIAFFLLERRQMIPKNKIAKLFFESGIFFCSMVFAPPMGCAMFQQNSSVNVSSIEEKFHNLKDNQGNEIKELYYNKGL